MTQEVFTGLVFTKSKLIWDNFYSSNHFIFLRKFVLFPHCWTFKSTHSHSQRLFFTFRVTCVCNCTLPGPLYLTLPQLQWCSNGTGIFFPFSLCVLPFIFWKKFTSLRRINQISKLSFFLTSFHSIILIILFSVPYEVHFV